MWGTKLYRSIQREVNAYNIYTDIKYRIWVNIKVSWDIKLVLYKQWDKLVPYTQWHCFIHVIFMYLQWMAKSEKNTHTCFHSFRLMLRHLNNFCFSVFFPPNFSYVNLPKLNLFNSKLTWRIADPPNIQIYDKYGLIYHSYKTVYSSLFLHSWDYIQYLFCLCVSQYLRSG